MIEIPRILGTWLKKEKKNKPCNLNSVRWNWSVRGLHAVDHVFCTNTSNSDAVFRKRLSELKISDNYLDGAKLCHW